MGSSRAVIEAVMAEALKDRPELSWAIGHRLAAENTSPGRVDWVPRSGTFHSPQHSGFNPRPLHNRETLWAVMCWGIDHDDAEAIMEIVVRGAHLALGAGGYSLESEEWSDAAKLSAGEQVIVGINLGIPVLDRPQPTLAANTGTANVTGTVRTP